VENLKRFPEFSDRSLPRLLGLSTTSHLSTDPPVLKATGLGDDNNNGSP